MRWSAAPHAIRSKNVVLPDGIAPASIHIHDGRIQRVGPFDDAGAPSLDTLDVHDLHVMPGLVDTHVHVNEPGRTDWEGFATATAAAAAGGVTAILDMPLNSVPATTNPNALDKKRRAAQGKCHVDVGFLGGVVPGNEKQLKPLWDAGVHAFKCFLVPSGVAEFRHVTAEHLDAAMPILAKLDATLMAHCELEGQLGAREPGRGTRRHAEYEASRPPRSEVAAIWMLRDLTKKHGARSHVVHVSSHDGVEEIRRAREEMEIAFTAETCPHYLTIDSADVPDGGTEFKCAPPIRGKKHQDQLWAGLRAGILEMIVSDHSPCPPASKRQDTGDFHAAWGGIASLELGLAAVVTGMRQRGYPLDHLGHWMAAFPAWLVSIDRRKGRIEAGLDADFAIFDAGSTFTVDQAALQQRHKLTPYHGRELSGRVRATYLRGKLIYADNKLVGGPNGQLLSRNS